MQNALSDYPGSMTPDNAVEALTIERGIKNLDRVTTSSDGKGKWMKKCSKGLKNFLPVSMPQSMMSMLKKENVFWKGKK